jgi:hypothetical protein
VDQRFYEAWFNTEHKVLGRRLHPFSLQDALILSLAESPFLLGTEDEGLSYGLTDLQVAVTICSTPAEIFLGARLTRTWGTWLRQACWTERCKRMDLEEQCQRFVCYIDDYNSAPELWHDEDDAGDGELSAPWVLANAVFLIRHTTFTPGEAWTMPLGKALWYCATLSEQLGAKIQFVSEDEQAGLEALGLA